MDKSKPLMTPEDILPHLKFIRSKKQEYVVCLSLDSGNRLIARRVVTIGTLDTSLIHPREVFAGPLKDRAASIIVAHNHPSDGPNPSGADIVVTQQLVAAGQLLGVKVQDHIIVSRLSFFSFRLTGYLAQIDLCI
jgi:DNA repair protein RadC